VVAPGGVVKALALVVVAGCAATPPPAAHHANVAGLAMYYEEYGHGRPLVLLHGGGSTAQTSFGAVIPAFARTHHVIAPEQQAFGHSGDRATPLSFEQMADDTATLLEQLGIRDADVVGFSNGGVVALELAIRHPALVHRLVLCSSFHERADLPDALWNGMEHATMADMPPPLREAFIASAPDPTQVQVRFRKQVELMRSFRDLPDNALHAIAAPTLVMVGDADVMTPGAALGLARLIPHAELAVLPGSGHGTYLGSVEGAKPGSPLPAIGATMIESFLQAKL
jgi:pimeloyl-ACP methyl ester carboxylesterase